MKPLPTQVIKAVNVISDIPTNKARTALSFADKTTYDGTVFKRIKDISDNDVKDLIKRVRTSFKYQPDDDGIRNIIKKVKKGEIATTSEIKTIIKNKLPHSDYSSIKKRTRMIANNLGFKNETSFYNYIDDIRDPYRLNLSQTQRFSRVFIYLSKFAKKHPGSIAKVAIAGGTIATMIIFLKKFQNKHTGCFRYSKDDKDESLIKYKFRGSSFCNNNNNNDDDEYYYDDSDLKLISEEEHPLYGKRKWDCSFDAFERNSRVDAILNRGCRGLCDWENFNILAGHTRGLYEPIKLESMDESKYSRYLFKCEKMTVLRALSTSTGNALHEVFSGLIDSQLGENIVRLLTRAVIIILLLIIMYNLYSYLKVNKTNNTLLNDNDVYNFYNFKKS